MVRPPCRSRSSWPLKVQLIDSITCRKGLKNRVPGRGFLTLSGRTEQFDSRCCQAGFEVFAEVVLVTDQDLSAIVWPGDGRAANKDVLEDGAFVGLGAGQGPAHWAVSYTHLRAHETVLDLVCRLLL